MHNHWTGASRGVGRQPSADVRQCSPAEARAWPRSAQENRLHGSRGGENVAAMAQGAYRVQSHGGTRKSRQRVRSCVRGGGEDDGGGWGKELQQAAPGPASQRARPSRAGAVSRDKGRRGQGHRAGIFAKDISGRVRPPSRSPPAPLAAAGCPGRRGALGTGVWVPGCRPRAEARQPLNKNTVRASGGWGPWRRCDRRRASPRRLVHRAQAEIPRLGRGRAPR